MPLCRWLRSSHYSFAGRAAIAGFSALLGYRLSQQMTLALREELICHMTALSVDWHERTQIGEKLSRLMQDVDQVGQIASDAGNTMLRSLLIFVLNLGIMCRLNWRMALTVLRFFRCFYG